MLSLSMVIFDIPRALYHETEKWFVSVIPRVVVLSYRVMLSNICLKFSQWIGKIRLHFIMLCSCWCIHYHTQFSRQVSDVSYLSFWWREAGTVNVPPFLLLWHFLLNAFIYLSIYLFIHPWNLYISYGWHSNRSTPHAGRLKSLVRRMINISLEWESINKFYAVFSRSVSWKQIS